MTCRLDRLWTSPWSESGFISDDFHNPDPFFWPIKFYWSNRSNFIVDRSIFYR